MSERILIDTGPSERGWHRLEAYLRCPRLYAYTQILRVGGDEGFGDRMPLIRGTLGHVGLAHYYARMQEEQCERDPDRYYEPLDAIDAMVEKIKRLRSRTSADIAVAQQEPVKRAVRGYMANYAMDRLTVVGVESPVEIQFTEDPRTRMTQRIDLEVQDTRGGVWAWDHKFVSRIDSRVSRRYTMSGQFLEMHWQMRKKHGDRFAGLRVNLVAVQDPPQFRRVTPEPAPHALASFPQVVADAESLIALCERTRPDPWTWPQTPSEFSCVTPYGECDAVELCKWGKTGLEG